MLARRIARAAQLSTTLTAAAHPDFVDVDLRWTALLTDSDVLEDLDAEVAR
jgi:hypothetical protein